jgi:hypothetical protein
MNFRYRLPLVRRLCALLVWTTPLISSLCAAQAVTPPQSKYFSTLPRSGTPRINWPGMAIFDRPAGQTTTMCMPLMATAQRSLAVRHGSTWR